MLRKLFVTASAIATLFVMSPQMASAEWYDSGVRLTAGQNAKFSFTGTLSFVNTNIGILCHSATATIEMTGGTTDGHITEWKVEEPTKCEISGGLVFLTGGTTTLKNLELTGKPTAVNNGGQDIQITGIVLHAYFHNGFKLTFESLAGSPLTAVPDIASGFKTLALSGTLKSGTGDTTVGGHLILEAPNSGTYGVKP